MRKQIPPNLRELVWITYNVESNSLTNPCFVCKRIISFTQMECGHVVSHSHGGEAKLSNLRPICTSCNRSMGTKNIHDYIDEFYSYENYQTAKLKKSKKAKKRKSKKKYKKKKTLWSKIVKFLT